MQREDEPSLLRPTPLIRATPFLVASLLLVSSALPGRAQPSTAHDSRNDLPPLLEYLDGRRVETREDWERRRSEIRALLIEHFIGSFPDEAPGILENRIVSEEQASDGSTRHRIRLTLATPGRVFFEMAVWTPPGEGPFPLLLTAPRFYHRFWAEDALARGYAVCLYPGVDSHHREADYPDYDSIWNTVRKEYPKATWTEISAKGWLASRCLDFLLAEESVVAVDPAKIGIIGFSRYGKQAMIATAFDSRIGCVVARSPGSPGSCPYRYTSRDTFAEAPADFPSEWFLPSLRQFHGREDELPIDAHGWYALIAPRPCLIHTAHNDGAEPTFAVEKAYLEGRDVYRLLGAPENLRIDYRPGGHSTGPRNEPITAEERQRNLDWMDLAFGRGKTDRNDFPETLLHDFDWDQWRARQDEDDFAISPDASPEERIEWLLGEEPERQPPAPKVVFFTEEESVLLRHDHLKPNEVDRVAVNFGEGVCGNLYFPREAKGPLPVVIWLHPYSHHKGYVASYGVQGTMTHHRLARHGFAVLAYDQLGFGSRLLEGTDFYDRHPRWSKMGRMVRDARDAVSFAVNGKGEAEAAIPELDPRRVCLLGYSAGALTAMLAGALDDRVAGTACFAGWTPLRKGDNRRLWETHALLPRLGLYAGREAELPVEHDDALRLLARKPCLLVTPIHDRHADHKAVAGMIRSLRRERPLLTWMAPDAINQFQAEEQRLFIAWARTLEH